MGLRGPKPKGAAYHMLRGTYRPSRYGPLPEPTATAIPSEPPDDDPGVVKRRAEIAEQLRRIKGGNG